MVPPATDVLLPSPNISTEQTVGTNNPFDVGLRTKSSELKFFGTLEPRRFNRKDSPQNEKQILVDPISLRESSLGEASFNLMIPHSVKTSEPPPAVLSVKPQLLSCSLPNSACSSPRFSFALLKKRWKNDSQASPRQIENLTLRHSAASSHLTLQPDIHLRRSKSCAERISFSAADELDFWFNKPNAGEHGSKHRESLPKPEDQKQDGKKINVRSMDSNDESFKCGALCLYLPGFGRAKPVRPKREFQVAAEPANVISRTVSLEKFECGSWASSAIINDHGDGDSTNLYFDLPLELIRTGVNDATSPVAAAFVFDRDRKGVLKNNSTRLTARKSHEFSRHVRFSTSSPTSYPASPASCITPRLRKAREDFNAFLEAQSA